jgi:aminopeptidase-like protein
MSLGKNMFDSAKNIFHIHRSITGEGVRKTLNYFKESIPELNIRSVPSGTKVFDWIVPDEWEILEAFIDDEFGNRILDFKNHNLHVVSYSLPIDKWVDLKELNKHLFSLPELPNAIPYITSYYKRIWGFCIKDEDRKKLLDVKYRVFIKSRHFKGIMNFGELIIPGKTKKEILLSTYICYPSMANNEVSGPVVTAELCKYLNQKEENKYTYRILFLPETIGSIMYLALDENYKVLKDNLIAGFQITCVGDDNNISFVPSRLGNTLSDKVVRYFLLKFVDNYKEYSFLDRGSDERQWCSPGIDLPVVSLMRTKYYDYKEYHTSLDNLTFISESGLFGGYNNILNCLKIIEINGFYKTKILCEPMMSKYGLYPEISTKNTKIVVKDIMNVLTYCDGEHDLIDLANLLNINIFEISEIIDKLVKNNIVYEI